MMHPLKAPFERRVRALLRSIQPMLAGDVEPLHQCRVATRRLRELLPLCEVELSGRLASRTCRRIRRLGRSLGPVRELDVALGLVQELEQEGWVRPTGAARLRQRVREERDRQRQRMSVRLKPAGLRKLERDVAEVLKVIGLRDATDEWALVLSTRIDRRAERLLDAVTDAGAMYVSERVHEVRIAAKQLRYVLELSKDTGAAGLVVGQTEKAIASLKALQDTLGRLHDLEILQGLLRTIESPRALDELWVVQLDALDRDLTEECRRLHGQFVAGQSTLLEIGRMAERLASSIRNDRGDRSGGSRLLKMTLEGGNVSRMARGRRQ